MKSFFITGAAGFIGSHICEHISLNFPKAKIYALDKLTYAGDISNVAEAKNNDRYTFVLGDICDEVLVNQLFKENSISLFFSS